MKTAMEQVMSFLKDDYDRANIQVRNYIAGILKLEKKCMEIELKQLRKAFDAGVESGESKTVNALGDKPTFNTYFKTTYNEKD